MGPVPPSGRDAPPDRLAEGLRAPGAFAVDAGSGAPIAPVGMEPPPSAATAALLAFGRDRRNGAGATLLDLALDGPGAPPTTAACRVVELDDGRRAILVVPIDDGARAAKANRAPAAASQPAPATVRILWQSDADGVVTHVGERLKRLVGPEAAAIIGRRWTELIGDLILDGSGGLAGALARRETASAVELLWSRDRGAGPAAMQWSGLPVFDGARRFRGFRGFLLAPVEEEVGPLETPSPHQTEAGPATADESEKAAPQAPLMDAPPPPPQDAPALPLMPHLSQAERNAFREIARALGARVPSRPEETPERPAATAAHPPRPANDARAATHPVDAADRASTAQEPDEPPADRSEPSADRAPDVAAEPSDAASAVADLASALKAELAREEPLAPGAVDAGATSPPDEKADPVASGDAGAVTPVEPAAPVVARFPTALAPAPGDPVREHAPDLLDRMPVGVLVNRGNRVLYANRTLLDLLDYPSIAAVAAHGGVSVLFKGRPPLSERDGPTGPILLAGRSGESIAVDARLQGVAWDNGPATLVTFRRAVEVDLNQRLRATELDLRAREGELRETRAVLDIATDGVAVLDEDGRILSLNSAAEALFGYEQNEVAGEPVSTLFAPESHASMGDYFEGLKAGGVRSVLNDGRELVGRVRQGGRISLFVTFGQIGERPARKFCAVLRDMSPWKKAERDLIDARKAAEAASAQKSDFLARISHEIRTPLNAIIGFAEVMMEERFGAIGNERYKDYLRDIHVSGGHVISLVNDLLDLSKIEAGKLDLDFASVNVNDVLRGATSLMQPQSQRARVVLRSALAAKLPPVVADERALKQVIINLLSNAVKFTDAGGQVIVSTALTDLGEVAIRIRDTGIGMTEKELSEAMEPFRQLATSRRSGGSGLGLPLTKALVEANRASLKMSSVKNEGTLAEVVFPPTRVLAE